MDVCQPWWGATCCVGRGLREGDCFLPMGKKTISSRKTGQGGWVVLGGKGNGEPINIYFGVKKSCSLKGGGRGSDPRTRWRTEAFPGSIMSIGSWVWEMTFIERGFEPFKEKGRS